LQHLTLLAVLALAACTPASDKPAISDTETPAASVAAPTPPASGNSLRADGWGPLTIGMTLAEVTAALGPDGDPDAVGGPDPESCDEFRPERAPEGLLVMIEDGRLSRLSVVDMLALKTGEGLGLGDMAEAVKSAHGAQAQATPHKYVEPPAEYITVWSGGPRADTHVEDEAARGVVYEIDGTGKVGAIHVGGPSIQYVEGCA